MQKLTNLPPIGLPPGAIILKHLPPGILAPLPPTLSPQDMQQLQFQTQYLQKMLNEIRQRLGNDTSTAHLAQVLKQMTAADKISCQPPFTSLLGCTFAPPSSLYQPIPGGPIVTRLSPQFLLSHNLTK